MHKSYNVDSEGYYGDFGGAYIPEMMYSNINELKSKYLEISSQADFVKEFDELLKKYVGRPTPFISQSDLQSKQVELKFI